MKAGLARTRLLTWGLVAVAVGFAATAWLVRSHRGENSRVALLLASQPLYQNDPSASSEFNEMMQMLVNDYGHARTWTQQDAANLAALASSDFPTVTTGSSVAMTAGESLELREMASAIISTRLMLGLPIEPEALPALKQALLTGLSDPRSRIRVGSISGVVQGRLVEDPAVRERINRLRTDPDPEVAANAARQLDHYDRLKASGRR